MRFHKNVSLELREILSADFRRYGKEVPMSAKERSELCKWVQSGHSPYDNGWYIATESGGPMDFINALRLTESETCYRIAYDTETDDLMFMVDADASDAVIELPF